MESFWSNHTHLHIFPLPLAWDAVLGQFHPSLLLGIGAVQVDPQAPCVCSRHADLQHSGAHQPLVEQRQPVVLREQERNQHPLPCTVHTHHTHTPLRPAFLSPAMFSPHILFFFFTKLFTLSWLSLLVQFIIPAPITSGCKLLVSPLITRTVYASPSTHRQGLEAGVHQVIAAGPEENLPHHHVDPLPGRQPQLVQPPARNQTQVAPEAGAAAAALVGAPPPLT